MQRLINIITVRKRSCGKVVFLHLSVGHFVHRGCLLQCMLGYSSRQTHPWANTPLGRYPRQTPPRQTSLWADTPRADTPPGRHPLPADSHCSGRYASYMNAFLFTINFVHCCFSVTLSFRKLLTHSAGNLILYLNGNYQKVTE